MEAQLTLAVEDYVIHQNRLFRVHLACTSVRTLRSIIEVDVQVRWQQSLRNEFRVHLHGVESTALVFSIPGAGPPNVALYAAWQLVAMVLRKRTVFHRSLTAGSDRIQEGN